MRDRYWWQKAAQVQIGRAGGGRVAVFERRKHGISDLIDLARWCSPVNCILDVGANTGQTAIRFRAAFPKARIISFEPIKASFEQLIRRTNGLDIECQSIALGRHAGRETMYIATMSIMNSLIRPPDRDLVGTEEVDMTTLDEFREQHSIDAIDLLKIDAEGADLEVLAGASRSLKAGRVHFVLVEAAFHPGDKRHPLFDDVREELLSYDFRVFGIYDQTLEWSGEPSLRYANVLFCWNPVVERLS